MVKATLFGTPSISINDASVSFPFKKVDALLYYMICKKSASRSELVNLLWENSNEEVGYKNLRHTIYTLKKVVGEEILISPQKSTLQLNPNVLIESDYWNTAEQDEAIGYKGIFLQGFSVKNTENFDNWIIQERDRLKENFLQKLFENVRHSLDEKDAKQAEKNIIAYLNEDPLDEQMTVLLMGVYKEQKLYHKASKVYQKFKDKVAEELGISPLNETKALYYEILNQWNNNSQENEVDTTQELPKDRSEILELINGFVKEFDASSGKRCSFLLSGEQGSGKSYVLKNFLNSLHLSSTYIFNASCYRSSMRNQFSLWSTIMLSVSNVILENDIKVPENIKGILKEVTPMIAGETTPVMQHSNDNGTSYINAVAMLFSVISRKARIIIAVEDIQWIDSASIEILETLLQKIHPNRLMIILSSNVFLPSQIKSCINRATSDGLLTIVDVPCLSFEQTKNFLNRKLNSLLDETALKRIYEETNGNPYLLDELAESILANGTFSEDLTSNHSIMSLRLVGLSLASRQLLDIISLFPDYALCEHIATITDKTPGELLDIYEELKGHSIIEEIDVLGESALIFTHAKWRDTVYKEQSYFKRKPLHLHIAKIIENSTWEFDSLVCNQLVYHYQNSGDKINATKYKIICLEHYSAGVYEYPPILEQNVQPPTGYTDNITNYLHGISLSLEELKKEHANDMAVKELEGILLCVKIRYGLFSGDYDMLTSSTKKIFEDPAFKDDIKILIKANRFMALYAARKNQHEEMASYLTAGITLAEQANDNIEFARFLLLTGYYYSKIGDFGRSSYYISEATDKLSKAPYSKKHIMFIMSTYHYMGENKRKQKDFAGACADFKMGIALLGEIDDKPGVSALYTDYARAVLALGDHSKARELFKIACQVYEKTDELLGRVMALSYRAYYEALANNYGESAKLLQIAHHYVLKGNVEQDVGIYWCVMAMLRYKMDLEKSHKNPLDDYLQQPLGIYCKKGINILSKIPFCYEVNILYEYIESELNKNRPYTSRELYSKIKNFTTE